MCGRFALALAHSDIQQVPGYPAIDIGEWINQDQFVPRYNIAPQSRAPVLRRREGGGAAVDGDRPAFFLHTMRWGVVPHWSKHEDKSLNTINARCENLITNGGLWRSIKGKKRCVVLAQGYYEWLKKGKDRIPWFTKHKDGRIMLLAGLYDSVVLEGEKEPLWTFSIVTTTANKEFEWLHERQPVILSSQAAIDTWLDVSSQTWSETLTNLVEPYHDSTSPLECYQVPKEVGRVGNESKTFIEPISQRKDGIQAMFSRHTQGSQPTTPVKRKRDSPIPEFSVESALDRSPPKKPKAGDTTISTSTATEEVQVDVTDSKNLQTPRKAKSKLPSRTTPSKKSPKKAQPSQGNKITEFFSKV